MPATKCPLCQQTRGRRDCLLKGGELICSACCADLRTPEACSECPHFASVKAHEIKKAIKKGERPFAADFESPADDDIDQALFLLERGKLEEGGRQIDQLLAQNPDSYMAHYAKGCSLAFQEGPREATPYFQKSVEMCPYFPEGWANLSKTYQDVADLPAAVASARKALELTSPGDPIYEQLTTFMALMKRTASREGITLNAYLEGFTLFNEALNLMQNGQNQEAIEFLNKSASIRPGNPSTYGNLGLCHAHLGEKALALQAIDRALEIDPHYLPGKQNREHIEKLEEGEPLEADAMEVNNPTDSSTWLSSGN